MKRFLALVAVLLLSSPRTFADDAGWPRTKTSGGYQVTVYQPQVDDWKDYATLDFRVAVAVAPTGGKDPSYGVLTGTASTSVNWQDRSVLVMSPKFGPIKFPGASADSATAYATAVQQSLPTGSSYELSLDRLLANLTRTQASQKSVEVSLAPPPIYYGSAPSILVVFTGNPAWQAVSGTSMLFATNTNWPVFLQEGTSNYFLLDVDGWLVTQDVVKGPWAPALVLPPDLSNLPTDGNWTRVKANVPGVTLDVAPTVFVSTQPAELIVTTGAPQLLSVPGTSLMYVSNTESDVFLDVSSGTNYFLAAGRWFSAPALSGPWSAATKTLPADFAKIPIDSPKADVLASVPGSPQAQEAVLQASIPHKAKVDVGSTFLSVSYQGDPNFTLIDGSQDVFAAQNTTYAVFRVGGAYYCCHDGIWFQAAASAGPWSVCSTVPQAIYSIPPSSPYHNVTYVYVYDSTPTTVTCGYTAGYTGEYVAGGLLMFGAGLWLGATAWGAYDAWHYPPSYYSYGCAAHYSYYSGAYVRGASYYGPYGGAGYGARYNPSTGTYARGAAVYGPAGAAGVAQAYNPWTGRSAATAQASTPYGSWGRSVTSDGNGWAETGHKSTAWGTTAGFQTSTGAAGALHAGAMGTTSVARSADGDVYAGHDGNVYKYNPSSSSWDSHTSDGWKSTGWSGASQAQQMQHPSAWGSGGDGGGGDVGRQLNGDSWGRSWGDYRSSGSGWGGGGGDRWGGGGGGWGGGGRSWGGGGGGGGGWGGGGGRGWGGGGRRR